MNTYIDEAGVFVVPANRQQYVCCLVGLTVPSMQERDIFFDFLRLRDQWGRPEVEVKGSSLSESQIAEVVELLRTRDVVAEVVAIDMARHTDAGISAFKEAQAASLTKNLTAAHHPNLVRQAASLQGRWGALPNQLFVQSYLIIALIRDLIQTTTLYYSQRLPSELAQFGWVIDAKDKAITEMERIWTTVVLPILETHALSEPLLFLKEADYSHFQRFLIDEATTDPDTRRHADWLKQHTGQDRTFSGIDARLLMEEHRRFANSRDELGLQLADVIANAFYRTLNGALRAEGWNELGTLLIARRRTALHFVELLTNADERSGVRLVDHPIADVVRHIEQKARSLWSR